MESPDVAQSRSTAVRNVEGAAVESGADLGYKELSRSSFHWLCANPNARRDDARELTLEPTSQDMSMNASRGRRMALALPSHDLQTTMRRRKAISGSRCHEASELEQSRHLPHAYRIRHTTYVSCFRKTRQCTPLLQPKSSGTRICRSRSVVGHCWTTLAERRRPTLSIVERQDELPTAYIEQTAITTET